MYPHTTVWWDKNTKMLRRNGPVIKSVESVLRPEESLWWETFVEDVDLIEPGVKQ